MKRGNKRKLLAGGLYWPLKGKDKNVLSESLILFSVYLCKFWWLSDCIPRPIKIISRSVDLKTTVNQKGVFCVVVIASLHLSAIYPSADDPCFICLSNSCLCLLLLIFFVFPFFFYWFELSAKNTTRNSIWRRSSRWLRLWLLWHHRRHRYMFCGHYWLHHFISATFESYYITVGTISIVSLPFHSVFYNNNNDILFKHTSFGENISHNPQIVTLS